MEIIFLGTNGWFATKTGNTVCAAIVLPDRLVVLDAGDGFSKVASVARRAGVRRIDVFLSHIHLDHVIGLHALPLIAEGTQVRIFAGKKYIPHLRRLLSHPFAAGLSQLKCSVRLVPLKGRKSRLPYEVEMLPLVHADPCFGFRFSLQGREIAYCTDTGPCANYSLLAKNCGLLITECALPPGAKPSPGWPHLSPQMAARLAREAGAGMLVLTHFGSSIYTSAATREGAGKAARKIFKNAHAAKDGMSVRI